MLSFVLCTNQSSPPTVTPPSKEPRGPAMKRARLSKDKEEEAEEETGPPAPQTKEQAGPPTTDDPEPPEPPEPPRPPQEDREHPGGPREEEEVDMTQGVILDNRTRHHDPDQGGGGEVTQGVTLDRKRARYHDPEGPLGGLLNQGEPPSPTTGARDRSHRSQGTP